MLFLDEEKRRRPFGIKTKRIEWLKAGGEKGKDTLVAYLGDAKVPKRMPTSHCRKCKKLLTWGGGNYEFDHKDNNQANNSQNNCYLVCKNCHGEVTKTRVVRQYDPFLGDVVGYKTQKLKVGYKKPAKKPVKKPARKRPSDVFDF